MRDDVEPVAHEMRDRIVFVTVTVVPFLALGVTVGFHRHFTHRSLKTTRAVCG